ncbi:hypothetical protein BpHYR1_017027 [Brachionus plicatilis]|uniref:Uncharacterized protein n=1 Tax=Brachionus plicatilis TaxID=10195 RepID=A0A3M7RQA2_BRAPC|nr:hypothetical protein BpHYR1_017027 [Brachionus plicatilis]
MFGLNEADSFSNSVVSSPESTSEMQNIEKTFFTNDFTRYALKKCPYLFFQKKVVEFRLNLEKFQNNLVLKISLQNTLQFFSFLKPFKINARNKREGCDTSFENECRVLRK